MKWRTLNESHYDNNIEANGIMFAACVETFRKCFLSGFRLKTLI